MLEGSQTIGLRTFLHCLYLPKPFPALVPLSELLALIIGRNMFASLHGPGWKDDRFAQFTSQPLKSHQWREVASTALPEGRPPVVNVPAGFGVKTDPGYGLSEPNPADVVLPPGHDSSSFGAFRQELESSIGKEWVEQIAGHFFDGDYINPSISHDAQALLERGDLVGSLIVYPGSVPDVQAIVRLANKHKVPLWVCSIGRNLGYGGAAPRLRGSVVLYLGKRMDAVEEVNEDLAYCRVQPGVSYMALYEHLHKVCFHSNSNEKQSSLLTELHIPVVRSAWAPSYG